MEDFEEFDQEKINATKTDLLQKNIAGSIDAVIVIIFYAISLFLNIIDYHNTKDSFNLLCIFAIFLSYRLVTIIIVGRTIGMIILGIEFSKEDGTKLNVNEKLLTIIMVYINNVDCFNKK